MNVTRRSLLASAAITLIPLLPLPARAQQSELKLRIGSLKFGTLNWLVETIRTEGFDKAEGLTLDAVDFASGQATTVALQAGDIDLIVSDWLWALRRTQDGERMRFAPFSTTLGALMVAADGPVKSLADLKERRSASPAARWTRAGCCCAPMARRSSASTSPRLPSRCSAPRRW